MSFAMGDFIMKKFPSANYVDASELVDRVKVIKSAEELELVRRAAIMQDGAMKAAFAAIKPGMRDTEVAAVAVHYSQDHGSENGIYLCASAPLGIAAEVRPAPRAEPHHQEGRHVRAAGRGLRPRRACSPSLAAPACSARCRSR